MERERCIFCTRWYCDGDCDSDTYMVKNGGVWEENHILISEHLAIEFPEEKPVEVPRQIIEARTIDPGVGRENPTDTYYYREPEGKRWYDQPWEALALPEDYFDDALIRQYRQGKLDLVRLMRLLSKAGQRRMKDELRREKPEPKRRLRKTCFTCGVHHYREGAKCEACHGQWLRKRRETMRKLEEVASQPKTEVLHCGQCFKPWVRDVVRGRKPRLCPSCRDEPRDAPSLEWEEPPRVEYALALRCPLCDRVETRMVQPGDLVPETCTACARVY